MRTYRSGYCFYFWNSKGHYVDSVYVLKCTDEILTFEYRGKSMRCSLAYANGKLFDWPHQVLGRSVYELYGYDINEDWHDAGYSVWPDDYDDE